MIMWWAIMLRSLFRKDLKALSRVWFTDRKHDLAFLEVLLGWITEETWAIMRQ